VDKCDIMPVAFGGAEDAAAAEQLIAVCGRGASACGKLGMRGAIRALRDCRLYVGNDTGTMHMAAAAGVQCVAIFSARNPPGKWFPYGSGHRVHRVAVSCEGCYLDVCAIGTHAVLDGNRARGNHSVMRRNPAGPRGTARIDGCQVDAV